MMSDFPTPDVTAETKPLAVRPIEPQALDIQHDTDPADDHGIARRIPHLGHALLFFVIVVVSLALCMGLTYGLSHIRTQAQVIAHPGLGLVAQGGGYLLALGFSMWLFPLFWERGFFKGVHWNFQIARRRWPWVLVVGFIVTIVAQVSLHFVSVPTDAPVDSMMQNARIIWVTAFFAVFLGPFMEELAFRGFLLPAVATAYDWLSMERSPAGLQRWQESTAHSNAALIFSAIVSSVPFAVMHAAQISYAWGVVGILYLVSLGLSYVRIRTQSLACSTLMHSAYNFTIFFVLFIGSDGFRHLEKITR